MLFTTQFWRSIGWALVRTFLAGVIPFIPGLTANPAETWPAAASTIVVLLVVTVATSLRGIPDPDAASWWQLLLSRGLRQFGQFVAAGLVGAVVVSDVDWRTLLVGAAASALSTVVLAALTILPSSPQMVEIADIAEYPAWDEITPDDLAELAELDTPQRAVED
ncbi:MAG: hypothetical protein QM804_10385 [Propionicimonas sp.]